MHFAEEPRQMFCHPARAAADLEQAQAAWIAFINKESSGKTNTSISHASARSSRLHRLRVLIQMSCRIARG